MKRYLLFNLCLLLSAIVPVYAGTLSKGEGMFTFTGYAPFADRPVDVYYYIPPTGDRATMPVVFVMQGADRGVSYLVDFWKQAAEERKFIFLLPHFDQALYPLSDYQETGVLTSDRKGVREPALQTSALIDEIFQFFQQKTETKAKKYHIYGHSAGGQFVQRFMLFYDSPYVDKAIIASPGWYTLPDTGQLFPYGTGDISYISKEIIQNYLSKNIILQLGKADTIRESYLRKTPEAEAQGQNRLERGRYFYKYITQLAADNDWSFNWQKEEVEGVGHHSVRMAGKALPILFQDSLRALFIGNSYTYYNQLPEMVKALAASSGDKLSVRMIEHGGWTLQKHAENKETTDAIKDGGWDFVVLQEQSQAPAKEREWVAMHMYPPAKELDNLRKMFNPSGKTVFYMTWGHNIETYNEMQQRIAESYVDITNQQDAWCAPVGIAFKRVREENPGIQLYDPDKSHPALPGSYLAANVFYSLFYQKPYRSDYYAGLPEQEAVYLQRIAQEVVFSNPTLWNVRKVPQPEEIKNSFYTDPDEPCTTPTLSKPLEEGLASLEEINRYLQTLVEKYPDKATLSSIGMTTEGRDIPILHLREHGKNRKVKVWIQAALHGNEPAGPEAICMVADYLLKDKEGRQLLSSLDIALLPVANPDGYALQNRRSGKGMDLNRDQSKYADPVSRLLKKAFIAWNPEVALDIHEYTPWRKEYDTYFNSRVAISDDVLFLPTGHPNIPETIRHFSVHVLQKQAEQALIDNGYTHHFYFTPKIENGEM
ncbi:MAG: succinylglutamate desuccinylase/aspartoacylase family protein [Tannerellaceae bacterium]|nr:succinylglutamate desuccinylase/aspartoacylase family protein [Tannerellaceae bacterium]